MMEKSLFGFIWKYSKRDQILLLLLTLVTFPVLWVTLELPKRIINDAIQAKTETVNLLGLELSQVQFLLLLCGAFLLAVIAHGLLKMRLNTMKGVLAERMLRRFRFRLIERLMGYPRSYFRTTSQGELVSMITSEAEPLGGLMGDALSQPVFQAGQMATILFFLFSQSVWFGLAAISLIPLQAWLIPRLQWQINLLNKKRIHEVREFATEIGETAAGVSDLRVNGGMRWRAAVIAHRLGRLFDIRFEIYQKKFFMKFLNNFINQLTPFFFYSVGGYLAIQGKVSVGALVAALAAYKDLSSPWKELLAYYNQVADMTVRWQTVLERFDQEPIVDERLFEGEPEEIPRLNGDIEIKDVTVVDEDGNEVLSDITVTIPGGSRAAFQVESPTARKALAELLTREVIPVRGSVTIGGIPLNSLHQEVIARRIGYAHSEPYIFRGTLGENLFMPLKRPPKPSEDAEIQKWIEDALRSGNPPHPLEGDWVDPSALGFRSREELLDWWFELVRAMEADEFMVRRTLTSVLTPGTMPDLERKIVELRPEIARRLEEAGLLDSVVHRFHPDKFNPASPLGLNLLYALPVRPISQTELAQRKGFLRALREEGLADEALDVALAVIDSLDATFGRDGTDHPIFRALNLDEELYFRLSRIAAKLRMGGEAAVSEEELGLLLTVPFTFSAEQIGPAFREEFKERVLAARKRARDRLLEELGDLFQPIEEDAYFPVMTVLGNAIFGRISRSAGAREEDVIRIVIDVINAHGLRRQVAQAIMCLETTPGAENLPHVFRERLAFSRAALKKPDILILESALASHDAESRARTRARLRELLPEATKIFIEKEFFNIEDYDLFVEIVNGRIKGIERAPSVDEAQKPDFARKLEAISRAPLFAGLDQRTLRLLAFSAQWYEAKAGQVIFREGDRPDAAYLCVEGRAALYFPDRELHSAPITEVLPGRLIGDLAVILDEPRVLDLVAEEESLFLRIPREELISVIENDPHVAASLLRTVAGHLANSTGLLREAAEHLNGQRESEPAG